MALSLNKETGKPSGLNGSQVTMTVYPTIFDARYTDGTKRLQYWDNLKAAIESRIPGADVGYTLAAPSRPSKIGASIETRQQTVNQGAFRLPFSVVSDNYFKMLGLTLRSGRLFDNTDNGASLNVAIVDDELARRYWPGKDVLGKRVQLEDGVWVTVVGLVSSVAGGTPFRKDELGVLYRPIRQAVPSEFRLLVRTPKTGADPRVALRAAAFAVDRDLPLRDLQTLDDYLEVLRFDYKNLIQLVVVFAIITAVIAATGLFGLISRSAVQRTQEVGIRRALGATSLQATSMLVRQGAVYLSMSVVGVALGVMMMPLLSRTITNIMEYAFPVTLGIVLLMAAVIFTASYLPGRRAVALEPGDALRYE
jgi:putative ABC transport system permease protein